MTNIALTQRQPSTVKLDTTPLQEVATLAPPACIEHAQTVGTLLNRRATRMMSNLTSSAGLAQQALNPQTWVELQQLQQAVVQRLQQQNQNWMDGCATLVKEYSQIKQANTMSKLVEQQCNLVAQWGQLLGTQATNLMGLQENIEVDYGYWLSEKVKQ